MVKIGPSQILIIFLFKVAPPWADCWSDGLWVHKLITFGNEFHEFNVTDYGSFLLASEDCHTAQWFDGNDWINSTVKYKTVRLAVSDWSSYKQDHPEQDREMITAQDFMDLQPNDISARCLRDYGLWAIAAVIPLAVSIAFTLVIWWGEETGWAKVLLLPVVLVGLYSQYRAIRIIAIGLGYWPNKSIKQEDWVAEKKRFTHTTVSIEPTMESLPSLIVQVCLLATELVALFYGNRPSPLVDNPLLFKITFALTVLSTVLGLCHFLKDGPSPLISSSGFLDGFVTKEFAALFFSILLWLSAKCLVLIGVIDSVVRASTFNGKVPSSAGVDLSNFGVLSIITCWSSLMLLPQFLHSLIILTLSTKSKLPSLFLTFPSFLITPLFAPFVYKGTFVDGKYQFVVSIKHTLINILITLLITPLTMVLFYQELMWKWTYHYGLTPGQLSYQQSIIDGARDNNQVNQANKNIASRDISTQYNQFLATATVILPIVLLMFALIPIAFLLKNFIPCVCTCTCGNNQRGKHQNEAKFYPVGRKWKSCTEETMM